MLSRISEGRDWSVVRRRVERLAMTDASDRFIFRGGGRWDISVLVDDAFRLPLTRMGVSVMAGCAGARCAG